MLAHYLVADGTPRDCSSNRCGSQADTSIIRDREIASGRATPLGRTQGNGPVRAETMIANFMGTAGAAPPPTNRGAASSVGVEDNIRGANNARARARRQFSLSGLFGGGGQGTKNNFAVETSVAESAGRGAEEGLPTCSDTGEITMTFRQVSEILTLTVPRIDAQLTLRSPQINQDGAGPLTADVDGTSGGTEESAFRPAKVTQDVPGVGFQGLSLATNTDFPLKVQMPEGMTCDASVGGADNVCIVRVRNGAAAGPFGGSAAFTQSPAARKRAIAYRMRMRRARALGSKVTAE